MTTANQSDPRVEAIPAAAQDIVVLIHGLGANGQLLMWLLARRLKLAGYGTVIWSYPSLLGTIERHAKRLHKRLAELEADANVARIHLVTHSMGGIVARYALTLGRPIKLGRFVMMAPPNQGSALAALCGPALRWCLPAIDQLAARPNSFVNRLPQPDGIDIGIVAASRDILVGSGKTFLSCQRDHIVLPSTHTLLAFQRRVADEVIEFLRTGHFSPTASRTVCSQSKRPV
jgi:pimeloyl-ACP methyl ester carboxylesterase